MQEKNCKVVFLRIINTAWGERNEHNSSRNEHPHTFASSKEISDVTLLLLCQPEIRRLDDSFNEEAKRFYKKNLGPSLPRSPEHSSFGFTLLDMAKKTRDKLIALEKNTRIRKRFPLRVEYQKNIF